MKCPNDGTDMTKGFLLQSGQKWHEGDIVNNFFSSFLAWKSNAVEAWKCSKCNRIELKAGEIV